MASNKAQRLSGKEQKRIFRRVLKTLFLGNRVVMGIVCVALFFSTVASLATSLSIKIFLDRFILPSLSNPLADFSPFYQALLVLAGVYAFGVLCSFIHTRLLVVVGQGMMRRVRDEMFSHLQTLPIRYFDERANGDIMSLFSNDTDTLRQLVNMSLPQMLSSAIQIISTFVAMLVLSPLLTGMAVLLLLVQMLVVKSITRNTGKYFVRQQECMADVTAFVEELMTGQKVVKVFNREKRACADFAVHNDALCAASTGANMYASRVGPVVGNIGYLFFVLVAMVGGFLALQGWGHITVGVIAAYLQFTRSFSMPFMSIAQQANSVIQALAGAGRIFELIDEPSEQDTGLVHLVNVRETAAGTWEEVAEHTGHWAWKRNDSGELILQQGDVRFLEMNFGYTPEKQVLFDLNLYAKPGQKVAFVGSTGAGKTTITNLITRFYDVPDGTILYDGIPVEQICKQDLRQSIAVVLQDTHLFTGTIADNIRYGKLNATDEEVHEAAKLAHADGFIRMLPNGYNTRLTNDGEELSQGQRQLLAIARAAIADPPVLILDEATSSIDTRTERIVQRGMDNLMKGRTVFVIAHRLSTIRNADVILVLEHGRIMERGTHEALLEEKGLYWQLATGQKELD